jgi:hypothetical protein
VGGLGNALIGIIGVELIELEGLGLCDQAKREGGRFYPKNQNQATKMIQNR